MRKGMGLLLVLSLLLSGIMLATPVDSSNSEISVNALTPHAPIRIDSNADFLTVDGVTNNATGNGTVWAPWIIENWDINGTDAGYCIYVGNTTEHFIVRNCSLFNASGVSSYPFFMDSGIALFNSVNGSLHNNSLMENNWDGISLVFTNASILTQNRAYNNTLRGIELISSNNNTINDNNVSSNDWNGITLNKSNNNTIQNATAMNNTAEGILISEGENNTISNSTSMQNDFGIHVTTNSHNNTIIDNNVNENGQGILIRYSSHNCSIINNTASANNNSGIIIRSSNLTTIKDNLVSNSIYGFRLFDSNDSLIFHNSIIDNTFQSSSDNGTNFWDNGYPAGGNYWSDYSGPDNNYDGIGDIPYYIDADSKDNYPLMAPWTAPLVADIIPPLALNHTPANNATDVPINSTIQIIWNETMNWTSVEGALNYTDGTNNYSSANGTWQHNSTTNVSTFTPTDVFAYETQYFVTMNITATDIIGNRLDQDGNGTGGCWPDDVLQWNFTTTDASPYVISTGPAPNQVNVDPATPIIITFSEPMNQSAVEDAFSYTNGTAVFNSGNGTEFWNQDRSEFTFVPVPVLEKNQTFTVSINGSMARDMGGKIMGSNYSWPFTTWKEPPAPHVTDNYPVSGAFNVPVNTHINLVFDMEMDIVAVQNAFTYTDGNGTWNASDGMVDWYSGNTLFSFQPDDNLNFDSTYTVILGTNASSTYGKTLDGNNNGVAESHDDFVFTFTTAKEPPTITSHYPGKNALNIPIMLPAIFINFSKPMDTTSVTNGISIYPNTPFTPSFSSDQMNLTLLLNDELLEATQYRITIMSTAMDLVGTKIDGNGDGAGGDRFIFNFFTEGIVIPQNPVIIYVYPTVNSTIPISEFFIAITFSQDMNRTSVEKAFTFGNESSQINGTFSWRSGSTMMLNY
jgi:parallel beta-helix repeat protein